MYRKIKVSENTTDVFRLYLGFDQDSLCNLLKFHIISIRRSIRYFKSAANRKKKEPMTRNELTAEIGVAIEIIQKAVQSSLGKKAQLSFGYELKNDIKKLFREVEQVVYELAKDDPDFLKMHMTKRVITNEKLVKYVEDKW